MKRTLLILLLASSLITCKKDSDSQGSSCGTYNGKQLHKGPEGGCYYINSNDNKEYVDKPLCKCN